MVWISMGLVLHGIFSISWFRHSGARANSSGIGWHKLALHFGRQLGQAHDGEMKVERAGMGLMDGTAQLWVGGEAIGSIGHTSAGHTRCGTPKHSVNERRQGTRFNAASSKDHTNLGWGDAQ